MNYVYLNDAVIPPVCNICVEMPVYDICSFLSFFPRSLCLHLSFAPLLSIFLDSVFLAQTQLSRSDLLGFKKGPQRQKTAQSATVVILCKSYFEYFIAALGSLLKLHVGRLYYCFLHCVFIYMYKLSKSNTVFHFLIYSAMLVFLSIANYISVSIYYSPRPNGEIIF